MPTKSLSPILTFVPLFLLICVFYNIHETIFYAPTSTSSWRQADSASITINYYQNGMDFWKQEYHLQGADAGRRLTECPILYYGIAGLYHIFGPQDWVFRGVNFLILFFGLLALAKMTHQIFDKKVLTIGLPLLVFSSPLINFYGPNFLPNAPAFGLTLIGIYFFYQYFIKNKIKYFYGSMLFFTIAGLIKLTSLIPFFLILAFYGLSILNIKSINFKPIFFQQKLKILPGFLFVLSLVGWWVLGTEDAGTLEPIWKVDTATRAMTLDYVLAESFPDLFAPVAWIFIGGMFFFILFSPKKIGYPFYIANILIFIGVTIVFCGIFKPLFSHTYYFVEFMVFPLFVLFTFIFYLKNKRSDIFEHRLFNPIFIALLIAHIIYGKVELNKKYDINGREYQMYNKRQTDAQDIRKFLYSQGVQPTDRVISAPDYSPNVTLYLMNLKGWSEFSSPYAPISPETIEAYGYCCAKYLIIHDKEYLKREDLQPFFKYPVANYEDFLFIFDLSYLKVD